MEAHVTCDMPEDYAKGLTTEELVDYAVNYPFLMDVLAFDKLEDGMDHLEENSGVFKELFSRTDIIEELIDEYKNMEVNYEEVANGNALSTDYDAQMFIEEYMGLNYESLSKNESSEFVEAYGEKYEEMIKSVEDSTLTTIFYDCIEEVMGEIPEDAIPDSVEEDIVASTDVGGASFTKLSSGKCGVCGQKQDYGKITVKAKTVYVYKWTSGGYSNADIKNLDALENSYAYN